MGIKLKHLPGLYYFFKANKKVTKILAVVLVVFSIILVAVIFLAYNIISGIFGSFSQNVPAVSDLTSNIPTNWSQIEGFFISAVNWLNGMVNKYSSLLELLKNF